MILCRDSYATIFSIMIALYALCLLLDTRASIDMVVETLAHEMIMSQDQSVEKARKINTDRLIAG